MNSLSWMIYLADIFDGLPQGFGAVGTIIAIGGMVSVAVGTVRWHYWTFEDNTANKASDELLRISLRKYGKRSVFSGAAMVLLAILMPSSSTIYLIAASEAGEAVVTSPEAKEMLGDLKEIIRRRLKDELKGEVGV